jgi:hypothetical protein
MVNDVDSLTPGRVGEGTIRVPSYLVEDEQHAAPEASKGLGPNQTSCHVRPIFLYEIVAASHPLDGSFVAGELQPRL